LNACNASHEYYPAAAAAEATMTATLDFEYLVRTSQRMVFSIAYRYLRDAAAAEEVAQDVFWELHKRLGTVESNEHAVFWLRRVACHRSIDYARRHAAELRARSDAFTEPAQSDPPADPLLSKRLREAVATLPKKMRMVVLLRFQQEAKLEEIAEALGIPVNTVKSQLHRALAMLREKMQFMLEESSGMGGTWR